MKIQRTQIAHYLAKKFTTTTLHLSAFVLGCILVTSPLHATEVDQLVDYNIKEVREQFNEESHIENADNETKTEKKQIVAANEEYDYNKQD